MKQVRLWLLLAILIMTGLAGVQAQSKIYFCNDYTPEGTPIGASTDWTVNPGGGYITLLFTNGDKPINRPFLLFKISRLQAGVYQSVGSVKVTPSPDKTFVGTKYTFSTAGDYKIQVIDEEAIYVSDYVNIKVKEKVSQLSEDGTTPGSTFYYEGTKVRFCEKVNEDGSLQTESNLFYIGPKGGYVTISVESDKPIATDLLRVYVFKKAKGEFTEQVGMKTYRIRKEWHSTDFKYVFKEAGEYLIKVYNAQDVWINEGEVRIKQG